MPDFLPSFNTHLGLFLLLLLLLWFLFTTTTTDRLAAPLPPFAAESHQLNDLVQELAVDPRTVLVVAVRVVPQETGRKLTGTETGNLSHHITSATSHQSVTSRHIISISQSHQSRHITSHHSVTSHQSYHINQSVTSHLHYILDKFRHLRDSLPANQSVSQCVWRMCMYM